MLRRGRRRYFDNDGTLLSFDAPTEIAKQLKALVTRYPPKAATFAADESVKGTGKVAEPDLAGLYTGPVSIAYGLHLLDDVIEGRPAKEWAVDYLKVSEELKNKVHPVAAKFYGTAGEHVARAAVATVMRGSRESFDEFLGHLPVVIREVATGEDVDDEWVCGGAGYIYLLRMIRVRRPEFAHEIKPVEQNVIESMMSRGPGQKDVWRFRGRKYLGLSHGWIGNVTQILLSDPSRFTQLKPFLLDIISQQQKNGNWLAYNDDKEHRGIPGHTDPLYQLSHGGPGVVLCLMAVQHLCDQETQERIDAAVDDAQEAIWEYGYLSKESSLLHGAAGNSLVLLDPRRKETFLAYSELERLDAGVEDGSLEESEPRSGLQKGLLGRVFAFKEYEKGRSGVFVSFNDV